MTPPPLAGAGSTDLLTGLVYELLDAHQDTVDLAEAFREASWRAHIDYLRALQRRGRELLALVHHTADHLGGASR